MITRTYKCDDCGTVFEVDLDHSSDPDPDCPTCSVTLQWVPGMFSIATNKGKAMNVTQQILEEDYGLTNWKDNNREGDIAAMLPVETTADREAKARIEQEVQQLAQEQAQLKGQQANPALQAAVKGFWGPTGGAMPSMMAETLLASAKTGPGAGKTDPIKMLHDGKKAGLLPTGFRVIARAKM